MTIPTLVTNIQHKQYSSRLKKFYSTMRQMNISAEEDYGDSSGWDMSLPYPEFIKTYFVPYLKGNIQGNYFVLLDGSMFEVVKGDCMDIWYDVNGNAKPNEWGRDKFQFVYCPANMKGHCGPNKAGFCAFGTNFTRSKLLEYCSDKSSGGNYFHRRYCAGLLHKDNWEFAKDYPW